MTRHLIIFLLIILSACNKKTEDLIDPLKIQAVEYLNTNSFQVKRVDGSAFQAQKEAISLPYVGYDIDYKFEVDSEFHFKLTTTLSDCDYLLEADARKLIIPSNAEFDITFDKIESIESKSYNYYDPFLEQERTIFQLFLHFQDIDVLGYDIFDLRLTPCASNQSDISIAPELAPMQTIYIVSFESTMIEKLVEQIEILRN
ncbi:MAG: hypothetical protein KDC79_16570 [Cyclobacteriaceae bacterium]|nr:hypothetical protein [Cyclobacteriaceae bacterium]